mmetsp:Transcript_6561/g.19458  ORF Transcript_6561/g.19458 Transcript_6561/m.19458 type:complete len:208 (-) Transcript_6561:270-893(-)
MDGGAGGLLLPRRRGRFDGAVHLDRAHRREPPGRGARARHQPPGSPRTRRRPRHPAADRGRRRRLRRHHRRPLHLHDRRAARGYLEGPHHRRAVHGERHGRRHGCGPDLFRSRAGAEPGSEPRCLFAPRPRVPVDHPRCRHRRRHRAPRRPGHLAEGTPRGAAPDPGGGGCQGAAPSGVGWRPVARGPRDWRPCGRQEVAPKQTIPV